MKTQRPRKQRRVSNEEEQSVYMNGILQDVGIENHKFSNDMDGNRVEEYPNRIVLKFLIEVKKSGCLIHPKIIAFLKFLPL